MFLAIAIGIARWPYPFLPRHLTIVSSLTIGIPAFFLALGAEPAPLRAGIRAPGAAASPDRRAWSRPRDVRLVRHRAALRRAGGVAQTAATITLLIVGLWVLNLLARPITPGRAFLFGAMVGAFVVILGVPALRDWFALRPPERRGDVGRGRRAAAAGRGARDRLAGPAVAAAGRSNAPPGGRGAGVPPGPSLRTRDPDVHAGASFRLRAAVARSRMLHGARSRARRASIGCSCRRGSAPLRRRSRRRAGAASCGRRGNGRAGAGSSPARGSAPAVGAAAPSTRARTTCPRLDVPIEMYAMSSARLPLTVSRSTGSAAGSAQQCSVPESGRAIGFTGGVVGDVWARAGARRVPEVLGQPHRSVRGAEHAHADPGEAGGEDVRPVAVGVHPRVVERAVGRARSCRRRCSRRRSCTGRAGCRSSCGGSRWPPCWRSRSRRSCASVGSQVERGEVPGGALGVQAGEQVGRHLRRSWTRSAGLHFGALDDGENAYVRASANVIQ